MYKEKKNKARFLKIKRKTTFLALNREKNYVTSVERS